PHAFAAAAFASEQEQRLPVALVIVAGNQAQQCRLASAVATADTAVTTAVEAPVNIGEDGLVVVADINPAHLDWRRLQRNRRSAQQRFRQRTVAGSGSRIVCRRLVRGAGAAADHFAALQL